MGTEGLDPWLDLFKGTPDYPGKRTPKNRPEPKGQKDSLLDDRYNGAKGKEYVINGERKMMYTIGQLCKALGKSAVTLRMWESKGWIPKPSFRTPPPSGPQIPGKTSKGRRLYTQEQLDILIDAVEQYNIADPHHGDWEGFKKHIQENWKK